MPTNEILNIEEAMKLDEELKNWNDYIPMDLLNFIDRQEYFKRCTDEARTKFHQTRLNLPSGKKEREQYLINDLLDWVNEYPQFKKILK